MFMSSKKKYELIRASGLFDADYYRGIYGPEVDAQGDPLQHFLDVGLAQGRLPSEQFDPVLYRLLVPSCGDANPLLHRLNSSKPFGPRPLPKLFPEVVAALFPKGDSAAVKYRHEAEYVEVNREYPDGAAAVREMPFVTGGQRYALQVPEPDLLLERLRSDRPYAFARLPHGFWDALWMVEVAEAGIAADERAQRLPQQQRRALAARLCAAVRDRHGGFAPMFIEEVLADIPAHATHPDFLRSVSFKGAPSASEELFGRRTLVPPDIVLSIFSRYFRPEETLYDALLWKRLLIAGQLRELPDLCRSRPVVLVASRFFMDLDQRWQLDQFTHVRIPPRLSQWQRWDLLARTSDALAAALALGGRPPVVLMQCGGSLSYWLITRLFARFPQTFYIDLGQALNGWFFDLVDTHKSPWMRVYTRAVIENCRMEDFYRRLKGADYDEWFASLPHPQAADQAALEAGIVDDQTPAASPEPAQASTARIAPAANNGTVNVDELVRSIRARRPELFGARMTDDAAGALLDEALKAIREQVDGTQEGPFDVEALGTFQIRNVVRGEGKQQAIRRVVNFRTRKKEPGGPG